MTSVYGLKEETSFRDRESAGRALGMALKNRGTSASLVIGVTRGGVPVAFEVAKALDAPMDILVVKKIRAASAGGLFSGDLAIGAVCADGTRMLNDALVVQQHVTEVYLDQETWERTEEARQAERKYRAGYPARDVASQDVLIVDDGIATGATVTAAVFWARQHDARRVAVAAPVASKDACERLRRLADDVFGLATPADFWAVGQFYEEFHPVGDDEVKRLLEASLSEWPPRTANAV